MDSNLGHYKAYRLCSHSALALSATEPPASAENHSSNPQIKKAYPLECLTPVGARQVVKVAGSNISHKLRLSSVKPSDEGTYECRVIDFSGSVPQHHRAHAYLRVEPHRPGLRSADRDQTSRAQQTSRHQAAGGHLHAHPGHQVAGKELNRKEAVGGGGCGEDCKVL